jgi:hypothetical protein
VYLRKRHGIRWDLDQPHEPRSAIRNVFCPRPCKRAFRPVRWIWSKRPTYRSVSTVLHQFVVENVLPIHRVRVRTKLPDGPAWPADLSSLHTVRTTRKPYALPNSKNLSILLVQLRALKPGSHNNFSGNLPQVASTGGVRRAGLRRLFGYSARSHGSMLRPRQHRPAPRHSSCTCPQNVHTAIMLCTVGL